MNSAKGWLIHSKQKKKRFLLFSFNFIFEKWSYLVRLKIIIMSRISVRIFFSFLFFACRINDDGANMLLICLSVCYVLVPFFRAVTARCACSDSYSFELRLHLIVNWTEEGKMEHWRLCVWTTNASSPNELSNYFAREKKKSINSSLPQKMNAAPRLKATCSRVRRAHASKFAQQAPIRISFE